MDIEFHYHITYFWGQYEKARIKAFKKYEANLTWKKYKYGSNRIRGEKIFAAIKITKSN